MTMLHMHTHAIHIPAERSNTKEHTRVFFFKCFAGKSKIKFHNKRALLLGTSNLTPEMTIPDTLLTPIR